MRVDYSDHYTLKLNLNILTCATYVIKRKKKLKTLIFSFTCEQCYIDNK